MNKPVTFEAIVRANNGLIRIGKIQNKALEPFIGKNVMVKIKLKE